MPEKIRVKINGANLRNRHIYINELLDASGFLPPDIVGAANEADGIGRQVQLDVDGIGTIMTDVGAEPDGSGPRRFFRSRAWVPRFFELHGSEDGDYVEFEKLGPYHFRVSPTS